MDCLIGRWAGIIIQAMDSADKQRVKYVVR